MVDRVTYIARGQLGSIVTESEPVFTAVRVAGAAMANFIAIIVGRFGAMSSKSC